MANRVFQNVVYQMKDAVDRVVGVIDETGTVISCSELGQIGEVREGVAAVRQTAGDAFVRDGYAYHQFSNAKHNDAGYNMSHFHYDAHDIQENILVRSSLLHIIRIFHLTLFHREYA